MKFLTGALLSLAVIFSTAAAVQCDSKDTVQLKKQVNTFNLVSFCASFHLNDTSAITDCIANSALISSPCAQCFSSSVECSIKFCLDKCNGSAQEEGKVCKDCYADNCVPAFTQCSGLELPQTIIL
jgi:hypothetical protein